MGTYFLFYNSKVFFFKARFCDIGISNSYFCSTQESDLHTKRTGHTGFVDKTSEAAKPISLEAPKPKDDVEMEDIGDGSSSQQEGSHDLCDRLSHSVFYLTPL